MTTICWVKSTETYVNPDNSFYPMILYGNSYTGVFGCSAPVSYNLVAQPFTWGSFQPVDLTPQLLPPECRRR